MLMAYNFCGIVLTCSDVTFLRDHMSRQMKRATGQVTRKMRRRKESQVGVATLMWEWFKAGSSVV